MSCPGEGSSSAWGRGYQLEEFHNWGIDLEESRDRFQEELEIILKAWTGPVEYDGRFHKVRKVNVIPKPVQQPHPPVYVAAVSPSTYEWVIKNGYNVLTSFLHPLRAGVRTLRGVPQDGGCVRDVGQAGLPPGEVPVRCRDYRKGP